MEWKKTVVSFFKKSGISELFKKDGLFIKTSQKQLWGPLFPPVPCMYNSALVLQPNLWVLENFFSQTI